MKKKRKKHEKKWTFSFFFHFFFVLKVHSVSGRIWKFIFFSFRGFSGYLVRHHHSLFSFSNFKFMIMSNMNLLSYNFDSCTYSHPHSLKAFEVKICFQIFWAGNRKLQPSAKKKQKWKWIQNEGRKKSRFQNKF